MRITGGEFRGRKLISPTGNDIRPTSDMLKQAIFNIAMHKVANARVLDLFGGSGALGIEALSRGAAEVVFCDRSPDAVKLIKSNLDIIKSGAEVVSGDYSVGISRLRGRKFDLILLDPPYDSDIIETALERIFAAELPAPDCLIIVESSSKKELINLPKNATILSVRKYGVKGLTIIRAGE